MSINLSLQLLLHLVSVLNSLGFRYFTHLRIRHLKSDSGSLVIHTRGWTENVWKVVTNIDWGAVHGLLMVNLRHYKTSCTSVILLWAILIGHNAWPLSRHGRMLHGVRVSNRHETSNPVHSRSHWADAWLTVRLLQISCSVHSIFEVAIDYEVLSLAGVRWNHATASYAAQFQLISGAHRRVKELRHAAWMGRDILFYYALAGLQHHSYIRHGRDVGSLLVQRNRWDSIFWDLSKLSTVALFTEPQIDIWSHVKTGLLPSTNVK